MNTFAASRRLTLIDSHAHVQFPAYDADRDEVIRRARDAGIGIINIGTQYSTSEDAVHLAGQYPDGVWATVGFHPNHVSPVRGRTPQASAALGARASNGVDLNSHHDPWELREKAQEIFDYQKLLELARHPKVVAVGECGLDYAHFARKRSARLQNGASAEAFSEGGLPAEEIERRKAKQREIFRQQIELAQQVKRPLVIHCRDAFDDLIALLSANRYTLSAPAGVVHFFSGSRGDAQKLLDLEFYFSFGGVITFSRDYDEVIKKVPLERLLLETDAPYVSPAPYRGKRNEPAYVVEVAKKIAELRGMGFEEVAAKTTENAKKLFGI